MTFHLKRGIICAFLAFVSFQTLAADAYYDYVADLYLHESNQARTHKQVVRYTDGATGVLLQEILNPKRVKAVLVSYLDFTKRGESVPDIPKLFQPLNARYDAAFKKEPKAYEPEYLDCLEASAEMMATALSIMSVSAQPSASTKRRGKDADDQKPLADSFQSFLTSMRDLNAFANKAVATEIRNKVAKGMFSESGSKRALAIADRFASQ